MTCSQFHADGPIPVGNMCKQILLKTFKTRQQFTTRTIQVQSTSGSKVTEKIQSVFSEDNTKIKVNSGKGDRAKQFDRVFFEERL